MNANAYCIQYRLLFAGSRLPLSYVPIIWSFLFLMGIASSELIPESAMPSLHSRSLMFRTSPEQATLSAKLSRYRDTFSPSTFCLELYCAWKRIIFLIFFFLISSFNINSSYGAKSNFLTLFFACLGEFKSKSFENLVLSHDSSTSKTAALSHFNSLWARCIIFMITLSMDVCSSNKSCTTSNKFCDDIN